MQDSPAQSAPPESPKSPSRWRGYARDLAFVVFVFLAVSWWQKRDLLPDGAAPAQAMAWTTLDGQRLDAEALRGDAVLVHFWATWCGVCRQEFGTLGDVYSGLAPGQRLVTIVVDSGDEAQVRAFMRERGITYPVVMGDRQTAKAWRIGSLPTTYYLSPEGEIAFKDVGLTSGFGMRARLKLASLGL